MPVNNITKKKYDRVVNTITSYLKKKHKVSVVFVSSPCKDIDIATDGIYYPTERKIVVRTATKTYNKIITTLLHEAGHAELMCLHSRKYYIYFSNSYSREEEKIKSKNSRIDLLREEIAAWDRGYEISNRLKLNIPWQSYSKHYREAIYTNLISLSKVGEW